MKFSTNSCRILLKISASICNMVNAQMITNAVKNYHWLEFNFKIFSNALFECQPNQIQPKRIDYVKTYLEP
jgi:hypothetical protein